MENNETFTLEDEQPIKKKSNATIHVVYIILVLLLAGGFGYFFLENKKAHEALNNCGKEVVDLNTKRDSLLAQLDSLEKVYQSVVADNATLQSEKEEALKKIANLRSALNSKGADLKKAEASIASLQETAQQYLRQIDSLSVANKQLIDQNTLLTTEVAEVKKIDAEKTKQLEELTEKVEKASQLKAFNVIAIPLTDRSKPKFKAKKVAKIKTSATISENTVIDPGNKMIYLRITRGDGAVLSASSDNNFTYNGETIMFTESKEIAYNNKEINLDIYYKAHDDITAGTYKVVLICDGKEIGNTSFVLE